MSVTATRKVSGSPLPVRTERNYSTGRHEEQSVEVVDTTNNVLVRDDRDPESHQQQSFTKQEKKSPDQQFSDKNYVNNTLDALMSSGIFEDSDALPPSSRKVNVYDNNQSIIKEEERERTGHSYLKHFYENNRPFEEVDEFV